MRYYVIINGTNSLTIPGLAIKDLPPISKPLMRNQKETIDGRDGDIITELGYSAYDKALTIGLYGSYDINDIIAFFNQKGTIVFSDEPDKYYNFTILDQIDYDKLVKFRTATIRIHCQPFKYPVSETPVEIEAEYVTAQGEDITLNNTGVAPLEIGLKGNTSQPNTILPSRYTQVDYIESSGTQYIDTGMVANGETTTFELDFSPNALTNFNFILSARESSSSKRFDIGWGSNGLLFFGYNTISGGQQTSMSINTRYNTKKVGKNYYVNNELAWGPNLSEFTTPVNLIIFANNSNGTIANYARAKLYKFKLYENEILVRNFVPCYRNSDNEVGLFDLVNGIFYTNQGTGDFTYGSVAILPNPDYPQEVQVVTGDNTIKVVGKNLLDKTQIVSGNTSNWTVTQIKNGITLNHLRSYTTGQPQLDFKVKPNTTYTFSYTLSNENVGISIMADGGSWQYGTTTGSKTVTTASAGTISIRFSANAETSGDITYIQLEESTTPSTYTPYQSQEYEINLETLELCKIGNYQDYIYGSPNNWYKYKAIQKVVLNGSENWQSASSVASGTNRFYYDTSGIYSNSGTTDNALYYSDKFKPLVWEQLYSIDTTTMNAFCVNGYSTPQRTHIRIDSSLANSVANFKTWLSNNNVSLYYILATPTEEPITNAELIEQLNAILNAASYLDQTNISQENDNMPFILDVSALQKGSNEAIIDNEGNIYSKPIINIVGDGIVGVSLNGSQILSLDMTTYNDITIDTETMEAYDNNGLRNRQVTGNYNNLRLQPGENTISLNGGFTSATISKYKRWL